MSEYRLEMREICKSFPGVKALDHAQLRLRPGTVHALMGENGAGKSTLMKCMFGIYKMDEGELYFEGKKVEIHDPMEALNMGIAMVHQELQPIPARTVGENIFLGRYPMKKVLGIIPIVDHKKMYDNTAELLKKVRMEFDPKQMLGELSVSQMQSVEIAKAVSANCKVLILDEPTSSLTQNEVEALFRIIEDLKADGVSIVYISHKMDEILRISDEVTIMRDGQYVGTWDAKDLTTDTIITKMVGRELTNLFPKRENVPGEIVFEVEDFTSINPKSFRNASFTLRKGEILGVGGLVGAQRTELMEGIFGIRSHSKGTIKYNGKELKINRPKDAIDQGIAMLTEDRRASGILGVLSIADNISVARPGPPAPLQNRRREVRGAARGGALPQERGAHGRVQGIRHLCRSLQQGEQGQKALRRHLVGAWRPKKRGKCHYLIDNLMTARLKGAPFFWRHRQVVRQGSAKSSPPVQIRVAPQEAKSRDLQTEVPAFSCPNRSFPG